MKNKYEIRGDVTAIFVSSKKYGEHEFLIDTSLLKEVSEAAGSWSIKVLRGGAFKYIHGTPKGSDCKNMILLHRLVTKAPSDKFVDHINHNTLDNRLENLRLVTPAENLQNRRGADRHNRTSGIRGVSLNKRTGRWRVRVKLNGVQHHIGFFSDIKEAERAAIEARRRLLPYSVS
ncbi:HNH endonuclease [Paenibacillus humicus]|uniref:HNH endonuclease n=1 Tax=Paenibacillus humicus TaxID=412861 RepID=UPI003D281ACC